MISFNQIPLSLRVPGNYVEFDNSQANRGLPIMPSKVVVFGIRLAAGTVAAGVPTLISNAAQAVGYFGRGSMLAIMIAALKKANAFTELWAVAQDENAAGVKAAGTFTITGPATAAGTIALEIGGQRVETAVASGDPQNTIAANINTAIGAALDLDVTTGVAANVVTATARHKGLYGNDIDLRVSPLSTDALPAGVTIAVAAMSAGTTAPVLTASISALGDDWYNTWVVPYNDATSTTAISAELDRRWGPTVMAEGHAYSAAAGSVGTLAALGTGLNTPHLTIVGIQHPRHPPHVWAAVAGALAEFNGNIDPARPLQSLPYTGVLAPSIADRFIYSDRNTLLFDGISTYKVDPGGNVMVERMVTSYRVNAQNVADPSYLNVETIKTLAFLRYSLRARISQKFPRYKLADDTVQPAPGSNIVTPSIIRNEVIAWFSELIDAGLAEDMEQFKRDLRVERNASDPDRVDALIPPNLINQFRIFAGQIRFLQ